MVKSIKEVEEVLMYELKCYLDELKEYGNVGEDGVIRWSDELIGFESKEDVVVDFVNNCKR
jgi:hypothetical protein